MTTWSSEHPPHCPFLMPVIADRLWLHPRGLYCRRPGHPVRVLADSTLARLCTIERHDGCEGYRKSVAEGVMPFDIQFP